MIKQELYQNRAEDLTLKRYDKDIQLVPSAATISITKNNGDAMPDPVTDASVTIDSYGTMTYTVSATNTADLGENFIAEVKYTVSGVEYLYRFLFDIVKNKLGIIITSQDLLDEYSKLEQLYYTVHGEVTQIGAINEIIDDKNLMQDQNYFKGCKLKILSGDNKEFESKISSFDDSTRKITLVDNMTVLPAIGDKYIIEKSYDSEIQRSFEEITDWLRTRGYRPSLIIDDTDIREVHIVCAVMKVLQGCGEVERKNFEDYQRRYLQLREEMKLLYDTDETGEAEDSDETRPQVTFSR